MNRQQRRAQQRAGHPLPQRGEPEPPLFLVPIVLLGATLGLMALYTIILALSGCAGDQARALVHPEPGRHAMAPFMTDAQCRSILSQRLTFGALGAGAAFASGSSGLTAAFPNLPTEGRYAIGGAAVAMGITSAVFSFVSTTQSNDFNRFCTTAPALSSGSPRP